MSEIVLFKGQKVAPAFAHLNATKSLGSGIVAGGFPTVNYRGKVWSLKMQGNKYPFVRDDDGSPLTYLDIIIVGVSDYVSKTYYPPGEWDEDSAGAPVCASVKGDVPDPGVPIPQSKTCAACPNNAWATQPNGKRGKACQDHKRLAVLLMPKVTAKMLGSPLTEPAYLKVPPGSLVSLKRYGDQLAHQGFPPAAVITRVSFTADKLFEMNFEGKQVLTDKEAPLVLPLIEDPRTMRITGETPEIHEVKPAAKPVPKEEPIDTGLMEAFGGGNASVQEIIPPKQNGEAPRRGRGRPPKAAAAETIEHEPQAAKVAKPQEPMFDEDSTDLDHEVASLLSKKVSDMMT